jgi:hypothetical protein
MVGCEYLFEAHVATAFWAAAIEADVAGFSN